MNDSNELIVTYTFLSGNKNPNAEFFALLSFAKGMGIKPFFLPFDLDGNSAAYIERIGKIKGKKKVVYLHIDDITYLDKLKIVLPVLKEQNCIIIVGGHTSITNESWKLLEVFKEIDAILRKPEKFSPVRANVQTLWYNLSMTRIRLTDQGAYHHMMNRGYDGNAIFSGDKNKNYFPCHVYIFHNLTKGLYI